MKKFEFSFYNKILFDLPVTEHNFYLKCIPGNYQFQKIYDEEIVILPETDFTEGEDSFGNRSISGRMKEAHNDFTYSVSGKAILSKYKSIEDLDRIYLFETPQTSMNDMMLSFLSTLDLKNKSDIEKVRIISKAVNEKMEYAPDTTQIKTTAAEAFEQEKGVCQDYTHIVITLLRNVGIPARYCAGFMIGEGNSHAWVEYYIDGAWYGIDPTNDIEIEYGYIKLSHGRDCTDCEVERGCFVCAQGQVSQQIEVNVKVGELQ